MGSDDEQSSEREDNGSKTMQRRELLLGFLSLVSRGENGLFERDGASLFTQL